MAASPGRRHGRFDQAQPVSGVRPVLDDPDSDGTAARLLAVVRPDDMDAHSAPPLRVDYGHYHSRLICSCPAIAGCVQGRPLNLFCKKRVFRDGFRGRIAGPAC